ncbi:uncharacterized protein [Miscanthus floridulus]|uniref:uncharacterized protein n=1 Tax=Miscanthus floridulus TaxID=154761 RepID=UPI0034573F56
MSTGGYYPPQDLSIDPEEEEPQEPELDSPTPPTPKSTPEPAHNDPQEVEIVDLSKNEEEDIMEEDEPILTLGWTIKVWYKPGCEFSISHRRLMSLLQTYYSDWDAAVEYTCEEHAHPLEDTYWKVRVCITIKDEQKDASCPQDCPHEHWGYYPPQGLSMDPEEEGPQDPELDSPTPPTPESTPEPAQNDPQEIEIVDLSENEEEDIVEEDEPIPPLGWTIKVWYKPGCEFSVSHHRLMSLLQTYYSDWDVAVEYACEEHAHPLEDTYWKMPRAHKTARMSTGGYYPPQDLSIDPEEEEPQEPELDSPTPPMPESTPERAQNDPQEVEIVDLSKNKEEDIVEEDEPIPPLGWTIKMPHAHKTARMSTGGYYPPQGLSMDPEEEGPQEPELDSPTPPTPESTPEPAQNDPQEVEIVDLSENKEEDIVEEDEPIPPLGWTIKDAVVEYACEEHAHPLEDTYWKMPRAHKTVRMSTGGYYPPQGLSMDPEEEGPQEPELDSPTPPTPESTPEPAQNDPQEVEIIDLSKNEEEDIVEEDEPIPPLGWTKKTYYSDWDVAIEYACEEHAHLLEDTYWKMPRAHKTARMSTGGYYPPQDLSIDPEEEEPQEPELDSPTPPTPESTPELAQNDPQEVEIVDLSGNEEEDIVEEDEPIPPFGWTIKTYYSDWDAAVEYACEEHAHPLEDTYWKMPRAHKTVRMSTGGYYPPQGLSMDPEEEGPQEPELDSPTPPTPESTPEPAQNDPQEVEIIDLSENEEEDIVEEDEPIPPLGWTKKTYYSDWDVAIEYACEEHAHLLEDTYWKMPRAHKTARMSTGGYYPPQDLSIDTEEEEPLEPELDSPTPPTPESTPELAQNDPQEVEIVDLSGNEEEDIVEEDEPIPPFGWTIKVWYKPGCEFSISHHRLMSLLQTYYSDWDAAVEYACEEHAHPLEDTYWKMPRAHKTARMSTGGYYPPQDLSIDPEEEEPQEPELD